MSRRKYLFVCFALALAGCAGPTAESSRIAAASAKKSGVIVYWPCLIDQSFSGVTVYIDGKNAGRFTGCKFRYFDVAPGPHKIRIVEDMSPDLAGAFGIQGVTYQVPQGRPLYIRLFRLQYLQENVVSDDVGRREVAGLSSD